LDHYKETDGYSYGLDADIKAKMDAKYDVGKEKAAQQWLEKLTGLKKSGSFQEWLKNGVVLCNAINKIRSGSAQMNAPGSAFKERENVANYLKGSKALGVKESDLFMTEDLYENKNMGVVVQNIHALGAVAKSIGFRGPELSGSVTLAQENKREFSQETLAQGAATPSRQTQGSHGYQDESAKVTLDRQIIKNVSGHVASSVPSKQTSGDLGYESKRDTGLDKIIKNTEQLDANRGSAMMKKAPVASSSSSGSASAGAKFCSGCGAGRDSGAKFCSGCGHAF